MSGSQDEIPPPPPPPPSSSQTPTQQTPHTVSTIKLPILKKGEYDIWAMKMEHYLAHTDYPIWEVIQNENGPVSITTDTQGQIKVLPPRTAEEIVARERERKARTTLLMALPEDHLAKFHKMIDAKEMWDAIKSIFGGNDESKKMQKYILKQQFEEFSVSNSEGLHKGYDRFQSILSQLEIHGAGVSTEDANHKFLRSLPSAWSQVSLIIRTKPGVDSLSFDDLYNNLRVFENDVKGSTASSSSTQNIAFVSENTNSTNDLDEYDLEEIDLKWQVAMISMRMKKFYKKTGRKLQFDAKEPVGWDQEDMNLKLLRSLPSEWKYHALIWRNKAEIETISLDDLYNNLKIYEPELRDDSSHEISTTQSTTHIHHNGGNTICLDNLYDSVIFTFLASQSNSPQLSQEDLEQLHPDDLEEMDFQWEMATLTIRARRFIKKLKHGHFSKKKEFSFQEIRFKWKENNTRNIAWILLHKCLIAQDRIGGYDWSYQAEEEQPTNHALMAFTSSGSSSSSKSEVDSCSKTCLESVEARLVHYKKNEIVLEDSINVLKLESLNEILECQVIDKFKKGLGYIAATAASLAVEETVGDGVDEIDKQAELTDEMQLKQEDQGCVHALIELQLHVVHVVADEHEVDQHL
ncbi:hypothetical protein Tco_1312978 [Tanacetum coccineum]